MSHCKKTWVKPELIVLARTQPEEAVLLTCKYAMLSGDSETGYWSCMMQGDPSCVFCSDPKPS